MLDLVKFPYEYAMVSAMLPGWNFRERAYGLHHSVLQAAAWHREVVRGIQTFKDRDLVYGHSTLNESCLV